MDSNFIQMSEGGEFLNIDLNKLKIAQARQCLSIEEIVLKTGLARATVSKTFNGKIKPTPKTMGLIAKVLNVDVTDLLISYKES